MVARLQPTGRVLASRRQAALSAPVRGSASDVATQPAKHPISPAQADEQRSAKSLPRGHSQQCSLIGSREQPFRSNQGYGVASNAVRERLDLALQLTEPGLQIVDRLVQAHDFALA